MEGWFTQMEPDMKDFLKKMSTMEPVYYLTQMVLSNAKEGLKMENLLRDQNN